MSRLKVWTLILLCAGGFGLSIALGLALPGSAEARQPAVERDQLAREIKGLREEIKLLQAEIGVLRADIRTLMQSLQERPPTTEIVKPPIGLKPGKPSIVFTEVARSGGGAGSTGNLAGKLLGIDRPQDYKIVLYAFTDKWYVQPLAARPFTDVLDDGTWSSWTHLGNRYAALLVRPSSKPKATLQVLPPIDGKVICKAEVLARSR